MPTKDSTSFLHCFINLGILLKMWDSQKQRLAIDLSPGNTLRLAIDLSPGNTLGALQVRMNETPLTLLSILIAGIF